VNTSDMLELAARYADGIATPDEVTTLNDALRRDPQLRHAYLRYLNVDAALASAAAAARPASTHRARPRRMIAGLAALLTLAACAWLVLHGRSVTAAPPAVLIASTDAVWADADIELALRGGDTPTGLLRLKSGMAEFRLAHGATALILGPAAVRFPNPNQVEVQSGKALCRCPTPESRITLTTPATRIVDLGTEFAVEVAEGRPSTKVAVVSGEVRVGTAHTRVLRKGEAAEVGPDSVPRLTPLPAETLAQLLAADMPRSLDDAGPNLLSPAAWRITEGNVELSPTEWQIDVHARGHRMWPGARQTVVTGDIAGRLVVATVNAESPTDEPLVERQYAILKVSFLDENDREFATSYRHFLQSTEGPGATATAQVAAFAPPNTREVEVQLLLSARGQRDGSARFTHPRLVIAPTAPTAPTR
jgi:hypothetical protein